VGVGYWLLLREACGLISLLLLFVSPHAHIEAQGFVRDELEERLHGRVRSQGLDRVEVFRQELLAEERVNHAVTDFMQGQDRELFGVSFVAFLSPVFLGVEVMARHRATKRAVTEGARDRWRVGHIISPPVSLLVEQRAHG
jgi:hypothetical protein